MGGAQGPAEAREGRPGDGAYEEGVEARFVRDRPARPRKTIIARSRRRTSSGSSQPMRAPSFAFATVVILSTIRRDWLAQPITFARHDLEPEQRRFGFVGSEGADGDGHRRIEGVVLHDDHGSRLPRIVRAPGCASRSRRVSFVPVGHRIDECLVLTLVIAAGYCERLAVGLHLERPRADIRHPDLNGPEALPPQALAVATHLLT